MTRRLAHVYYSEYDEVLRVKIYLYKGSWLYDIEEYISQAEGWYTILSGTTPYNKPEDAVIAGRNKAENVYKKMVD